MILHLAAGLFVAAVSLGPQSPSPLATVQKIHVMPVGQDHEALRFQKLLSHELSKGGFVVMADKQEADAVLSGMLTTPVVDGQSRAYAEVDLVDRSGRRLWRGNFPSRRRWPSGQDYVRRLAEEIAGALKAALGGTRSSSWSKSNRTSHRSKYGQGVAHYTFCRMRSAAATSQGMRRRI